MDQFCSHCGNALGENSLFCNRCGQRVGANAPTAGQTLNPVPVEKTPSKTAVSEEWISQYRYGDRIVKNLKTRGKKAFAGILDWAGTIAFIYNVILLINVSYDRDLRDVLLIFAILSGGASILATVLHIAKLHLTSGVFSFAGAAFGLVSASFPWYRRSYYFDIDDADGLSIIIYVVVCSLLALAFVGLVLSLGQAEKYSKVSKKCHISLTNTHVLGYYITKSFDPKPTYFELNYSDIRAVRCDPEEDNNFFIDYIGGNIAMDLKDPEDAMREILEKRREIV